MKVITLLLAAAGLSACVPKPYMAGSLNDRKSPPDLEPIEHYITTPIAGAPGAMGAPVAPSAKKSQEHLNPIGHTSSNPMR